MKKLLGFRIGGAIFLISFLLVLGGALWAFFALRGISGPIILHFNNFGGINQIGRPAELLWIGLTGIAVVLANFFAALELWSRDRFLSGFLAAETLFFGILLFVGFAAIINVN